MRVPQGRAMRQPPVEGVDPGCGVKVGRVDVGKVQS